MTPRTAWRLDGVWLLDLAAGAASLAERLGGGFRPRPGGEATAAARFADWCAAYGGEAALVQRLDEDGVAVARARSLLGPVAAIDAALPDWAATLSALLAVATDEGGAGRSSAPMAGEISHPFHRVLAPLAAAARRLVEPSLRAGAGLAASALDGLEVHLRRTLHAVSCPVLELELEARAVTDELSFDGIFGAPASGADRLRVFERELLEGGLVERLVALPAWARLVGTICRQWMDSTEELAARLGEDRGAIAEAIFGRGAPALGAVAQVRAGLSDRHGDGRSVAILAFEDGRRVVYKPRDLAIEARFGELLDWLAARSRGRVELPSVPPMLVRRDYGYCGFVGGAPCASPGEVAAYYRRAGALIGLLQLLGGYDVHHENLVADGPRPTVIDGEALLVPERAAAAPDAAAGAWARLTGSVIATGLLPRWRVFAAGNSFDSAGLGPASAAAGTVLRSRWQPSERLGIERRPTPEETRPGPNLPRLGDHPEPADGYVAEIEGGLRGVWALVQSCGVDLLAAGGPFARLAAAPARHLHHPTERYAQLLERSILPAVLVDGAARSIVLEAPLAAAGPDPLARRLARAEIAAMERFDVPRFTVDPGSGAWRDSCGGAAIGGEDRAPGAAAARRRIEGLDEAALAQQVYFLRASFHGRAAAAPPEDGGGASGVRGLATGAAPASVSPATAITWARRIADQMRRQAVHGDDGTVTWVVPRIEHAAESYNLQPMGPGLYGGVAGVALFLGACARLTDDPEIEWLALAAARTARRWSQAHLVRLSPGATTGAGSVAYALGVLAELLDRPSLLEDGLAIAAAIPPPAPGRSDELLDVSAGAAGAIVALLALQRRAPQRGLQAAAERFGEALVTGWSLAGAAAVDDGRIGTGLAHGAAGLALALARLHRATGASRWREAALDLLACERDTFDFAVGNWPDLRPSRGARGRGFLVGWCGGAPGVALARLDCTSLDPAAGTDLAAGLATTLAAPMGIRDHVCCGNLGRLEILFEIGRRLERPGLVETARDRAARVVARAEAAGAFRLVPDPAIQIAHPGFHQGLAGIGYSLLRMAAPDELPCVLDWQ